jgi:glutamine synthetase
MTAPTVTINDIKSIINDKDIRHIKIGITDFNGVIRGKYISKQKLFSGLEKGLSFCDVILGSDINDELIPGMKSTGWHTGYPDAPIRIIPESIRLIPFEDSTLFFLCEFTDHASKICPRQLLKNIIARAEKHGLFPKAGMEFEFTAMEESPQTIHEKNFHNLTPISPGNCGYSTLRNSGFSNFYAELLSLGESMKFPLECLHTEIGPGVLEAALQANDILSAADEATLFKTFSKVLAQRGGWCLTFMAKINMQQQGHSGHTHISLSDKDGNNVFYDKEAKDTISETMRHFLGGQQQLMPEFLALVAPNVNSFTRLVPGFWAPTDATWGVDNRTCALRAIVNSKSAQRVEYRIPAADTNPYLALAAALASGLYGIENKIEPSAPIEGNAYTLDNIDPSLKLPTSLGDAATRLEQSDAAKDFFGELFIHDYAVTRHHEQNEANRQITNWQMQRYFELT